MDGSYKIGWNTFTGDKLCDCANCAQGKLTKEQYVEEIRALCGRMQPKVTLSRKEERNWVNSKEMVNSKDTRISGRSRSMYVSSDKKSRDFKSRKINRTASEAYKLVNHLTWAEQANHENGNNNKRDIMYYIDEEQPSDIEAFSDMVNGRSADPRILPAMIQTIRYLRQGYHQMLLDMKPKSKDFFDREFAKLERNRFYTRERGRAGTSSPEESDSGMTDWSYGRYCVSRKSNQSIISQNGDKMIYDSDWSHSRSDSGVTLLSNDNFSKQAINNYALRVAATNGDTDQVMHLTLQGCDLNHLGEDGWPPIELALRNSRFRCAIFLVEAGTEMETYTARKMQEYTEIIYKSRKYLHVLQTSL